MFEVVIPLMVALILGVFGFLGAILVVFVRGFGDMRERLGQVVGRLGGLEQRLGGVEERLMGFEGRLERFNDELKGFGGELRELKRLFEEHLREHKYK